MKILFVIRNMQMLERIGIMVVSAVLKEAKHQIELIQTEFDDVDEAMRKYKPDILAYSVTTGEHKHIIEFNKRLKKTYDFISVFGGPHPTFFPEMIAKEGVDIVCIGEGEGAFLDLTNVLEKGESIDKIKNLWVKKKNGEITRNPCRPLIQNLDELPLPDFDIIYKHDKNLREHREKRIIVSRGCPFKCTYCFNHKLAELYGMQQWGRVRRMSVGRVIEMVNHLKSKYPLDFIRFVDDTFIICSKEWIDEFAERWPKEIGLKFLCNVRANLVTPYVTAKLKEAGCFSAFMAIETADNKLRNTILRRNMTEEQIANAWKLLKKHDIKIGYYNILGLPVKDSLKYDLRTLEMNIKYKPTMAWSSIFTPYPKTELGEYSVKHGYFNGDFDNIPSNNKLGTVLNFNKKEKKKIVNLQRLFGITVQFPFLYPATKQLMKLPPNRLFLFLMFAYYGFTLKIRMSTLKVTPTQMFKWAKVVLRLMKE